METHPTYQPSVFFFRKKLRESQTCQRAVVLSLMVSAELEELRVWSAEKCVIPVGDYRTSGAALREGLRASVSHEQTILLGLYLCHELEQLKAQVREAGLIPPKWIVDESEAEAKGWARDTKSEDWAVNF